jgi:hypothetical protein
MVIALLLCLAATVATGIVAYGEQGKGPLAASPVTDTTSAIGNGASIAPSRRRKGADGKWTCFGKVESSAMSNEELEDAAAPVYQRI